MRRLLVQNVEQNDSFVWSSLLTEYHSHDVVACFIMKCLKKTVGDFTIG